MKASHRLSPDLLASKLTDWPRESDDTDLETILCYLTGKIANTPQLATGAAALLFEAMRHDRELLALLKKLGPELPEHLKNSGVKHPSELTDHYLGAFAAPASFIIVTPSFPQLPFATGLTLTQQSELGLLFSGGEPAVICADIRRLEIDGYIDWLIDRGNELRVAPIGAAEAAKKSWRLRPKLAAGEKVFDVTLTIRGHLGIDAVKNDVQTWLNQIALQDPGLFVPKRVSRQLQRARDPRWALRDLAVARLTYLLGFDQAREWTSEYRPHKGLRPVLASDWLAYFGERGQARDGPLFGGRKDPWSRAIEHGVAISHSRCDFT